LSRSVFIGDSETDMQAAQLAGCHAISWARDTRSAESQSSATAPFVTVSAQENSDIIARVQPLLAMSATTKSVFPPRNGNNYEIQRTSFAR
jgi:hypothetical protein